MGRPLSTTSSADEKFRNGNETAKTHNSMSYAATGAAAVAGLAVGAATGYYVAPQLTSAAVSAVAEAGKSVAGAISKGPDVAAGSVEAFGRQLTNLPGMGAAAGQTLPATFAPGGTWYNFVQPYTNVAGDVLGAGQTVVGTARGAAPAVAAGAAGTTLAVGAGSATGLGAAAVVPYVALPTVGFAMGPQVARGAINAGYLAPTANRMAALGMDTVRFTDNRFALTGGYDGGRFASLPRSGEVNTWNPSSWGTGLTFQPDGGIEQAQRELGSVLGNRTPMNRSLNNVERIAARGPIARFVTNFFRG